MEERNCANCKHFKQHYILSGIKFSGLNEGHCTHTLKNVESRKEICKHFVEVEKFETAEEESIERVIRKIKKDLNYITQYLKNKKS